MDFSEFPLNYHIPREGCRPWCGWELIIIIYRGGGKGANNYLGHKPYFKIKIDKGRMLLRPVIVNDNTYVLSWSYFVSAAGKYT